MFANIQGHDKTPCNTTTAEYAISLAEELGYRDSAACGI